MQLITAYPIFKIPHWLLASTIFDCEMAALDFQWIKIFKEVIQMTMFNKALTLKRPLIIPQNALRSQTGIQRMRLIGFWSS